MHCNSNCCLPIVIPSGQVISKSFSKSLKYYLSITLRTYCFERCWTVITSSPSSDKQVLHLPAAKQQLSTVLLRLRGLPNLAVQDSGSVRLQCLLSFSAHRQTILLHHQHVSGCQLIFLSFTHHHMWLNRSVPSPAIVQHPTENIFSFG